MLLLEESIQHFGIENDVLFPGKELCCGVQVFVVVFVVVVVVVVVVIVVVIFFNYFF